MINIFIAAINEWLRPLRHITNPILAQSLKDRIYKEMDLVISKELGKLEANLSFLAMIGSIATFVGLFGTVWGIMHSFQSIAASKNTTLAVVAPGIAEALLATAIGLMAAIPASAFYNILSEKIANFRVLMDDFSIELSSIISREIDQEK
jgi:biopolymer transport protein TolQ